MSGKSSPTIIEAPKPPAIPDPVAQSKQYYQEVLPLELQAKQQYGPQMAQEDYELFSQFAPQYSQTLADIDKQLYPETAKLQENLASQALAGMNAPVPQEIINQYQSDFNAGLGMNVNAPIGVSDRNIALIQLSKQWQDYYRDMGLSVAGRQPLQTPASPNFKDPSGGIQGFYGASQGYAGNQMAGYNSSLANRIITPKSNPMQGIGSLIGGIGGAMVGGPTGAMMGAAAGGYIGGSF